MRHRHEPPTEDWICPLTQTPYHVAWNDQEPYDSCDQCRPEASAEFLHEIQNLLDHLASLCLNPRFL